MVFECIFPIFRLHLGVHKGMKLNEMYLNKGMEKNVFKLGNGKEWNVFKQVNRMEKNGINLL